VESRSQSVEQVLGGNAVYYIPPYQRQYQWHEDLWQALIHDVAEIQNKSVEDPAHWLGILLLTTEGAVQFPSENSPTYAVIDGQQRLVTLVIWLSALYWHAKDNNQKINFELPKIATINPQKADQAPLRIVLKNDWCDASSRPYIDSQILQAYIYFRFVLWLGEESLREDQAVKVPPFLQSDNNKSIQTIWSEYLESKRGRDLKRSNEILSQSLIDATCSQLRVFTLIHEPQVDEAPAVIFDTLNGDRVQLQALDHVRNSVFVRLDTQRAANIFENYWAPAEQRLRDLKLKRQKPGVNFIYDYVISKGEKKKQGTINKNKGAGHFTKMTKNLQNEELENFLIKDLIPAMRVWPVVVEQRSNLEIDGTQFYIDDKILESISTIRELSAGPANPLVLLYLGAHVKGELLEEEVISRLKLIENYLVRLILSNEPLSPLRSKMMDICGKIDEKLDETSLIEALLDAGWVGNKDIESGFETRNMYEQAEPAALGAIFRGIEISLGRGANKFKVGNNNLYTIEHIYPRKGTKWEGDLKKWKTDPEKMRPFLHTLGNLTVVTKEHNSAVGNKRLIEKIDYPTAEGKSAPLNINKHWINKKKWTQSDIKKRGEQLLKRIFIYWPDHSPSDW